MERAFDLGNGEFGSEALKAVARYAAPLFWVSAAGGGERKVNNGTMFIIDVPEGLFAMTANHVFEKYLQAKESSASIACRIGCKGFDGPRGTLPFEPESCLIDRDPEADIATFRLSRSQVALIGSTPLTAWPPVVPRAGSGVAFAGFPGHERKFAGSLAPSFAVLPVMTVATSVSHRLISCQLERGVHGPGFPAAPANYDTGGLSGGPLLVDDGENGCWRLGGVITQGNAELDIVRASRVDRLRPDGTFERRAFTLQGRNAPLS